MRKEDAEDNIVVSIIKGIADAIIAFILIWS